MDGTGELEVRRPRPGPGIAREQPGPLAGWASVDPFGVAGRIAGLARRVPVIAAWEQRVVEPVEKRLLEVALARAQVLLDPPGVESPDPPPAELLARLAIESLEQTPQDAHRELYTSLLRRLVHDEVRMLAALADGSAYPVVHLAVRRDYVLRNASTLGRMAGVVLIDRTPTYLTDLLQHGLARLGPQDKALKDEYQLLLTENQVIAARAEADARRRLFGARVIRRTVRISDLGRDLWAACAL